MTEPDSSTLAYIGLQPHDILSAIENLGLRCDGRFLTLNSYENRVYQVGIEDSRPVVAKFYRPGRWSDDAILEEHAFSIELAEKEIPVVPPLTLQGRTLHHMNSFRISVSPCRGGRSPELDDKDMMRQLGRLIARIHLAGESSNFRHRPVIDIETFGHQSCDFLLESEFIPEEMIDIYEGLADHLFEGIEECFSRAGNTREIRLHGDFHPGNVLVDGEQLHIVDLDDARSGPAIQDLWMFLSGDREEQTPQLATLLEGYLEFRNFDARELNLLEALRSLRIMHYAAWIARRWEDPAFKTAFPWFNSRRYWDDHILSLREQVALMQESPLVWTG
ncbi:MAG: serine/threonine protein kinase [Proteobacteria bacterium]|nr:serine/threonine protein kinase [Pseudomonadota bacterium]MDA0993560.1 serine/threonine protein kinase [Pseudomonadota bacterium]